MKFDTSTPRNEITIQGNVYSVPAPFTGGQTINDNEASALNQTLAENIRNNMAQKIKAAVEKGEAVPTQADVDEYASEYEFGVRRGGTADPVMKEALSLARNHISAALKAQGKSVSAQELTQLAEEAVEKNPKIVDKARELVESRKAAAADLFAA